MSGLTTRKNKNASSECYPYWGTAPHRQRSPGAFLHSLFVGVTFHCPRRVMAWENVNCRGDVEIAQRFFETVFIRQLGPIRFVVRQRPGRGVGNEYGNSENRNGNQRLASRDMVDPCCNLEYWRSLSARQRHSATADDNGLPCHEARCVTKEKEDDRRNLFRLSHTPHRRRVN